MPVKPLQAPEIFQKPIASVDTAGLPPRGSPDFGPALIARIAMDYAGRGWNAVVTVDDAFVRVVAVPEHGMDPKTYVLGLLRERYLEDALPLLEALREHLPGSRIVLGIDTRSPASAVLAGSKLVDAIRVVELDPGASRFARLVAVLRLPILTDGD